jgi:hypothetical protein
MESINEAQRQSKWHNKEIKICQNKLEISASNAFVVKGGRATVVFVRP